MARLIAVDYGMKRVGIAVTDPDQVIATPLTALSPAELIPFLSGYISGNPVEGIVIGYPLKQDNSPTDMTGKVQALAKEIKKKFRDLEVYLHDERFTSGMALSAMISGGTTKKYRRNKSNMDKISATIILQSFLEQKGLRKG
jgi:putative Holliday junction resolvase